MVTSAPDDGYPEVLEALKNSYLYLRISLVGVVAAIFIAIASTPAEYKPEGAGILRSISHYYYTPARIVFTAALCGAALALISLAGRGVQNYLLDVAALLAPLIAFIPTRTLRTEVGEAAELGSCVAGWPARSDCIPRDQLAFVELGFYVWALFAAVGMLLALIRGLLKLRPGRTREPLWYWIALIVGVGILILYLSWWRTDAFVGLQLWGHITAAGTFFILIMLVAAIEAIRQAFSPNVRKPAYLPRRAYAAIYAILAITLVADVVTAIVVLASLSGAQQGDAIFWIEVIGLLAFALFWSFQTLEHARDADGWVSPAPPGSWSITNSNRIASRQQDLADAGYYSGAIDGRGGALTREGIRDFQVAQSLHATGEFDEATSTALRTAARALRR